MDPSNARSTKSAFWCGVLEGDAPGVAPGREVRTVRGQYTALRAPEKGVRSRRTRRPTGPAAERGLADAEK